MVRGPDISILVGSSSEANRNKNKVRTDLETQKLNWNNIDYVQTYATKDKEIQY